MTAKGSQKRPPSRSVLFIPVTGPSGAGEYYRCLAVAQSLWQRKPDLDIHFVVSRRATVTTPAGFTCHWLDDTPTRQTETVLDVLNSIRPTLAVFDSSFRTRQLQQAKRTGATVVCLVSRRRKRRQLMMPWKLAHIDRIWVTGETRPRGHPGWLEQILTRPWGGHFQFVGPVLPPMTSAKDGATFPQKFQDYVLVAPGGGGGMIHGEPAARVFHQAARILVEERGLRALFVPGPLYRGDWPEVEGLEIKDSLPPSEMRQAISRATVCLLGGGSLLLQGIAAGRACVAAPAGGRDQPQRIRQLAQGGLIMTPTRSDPAGLAQAVGRLWRDPSQRAALEHNAQNSEFKDSMAELSDALIDLLDTNDLWGATRD